VKISKYILFFPISVSVLFTTVAISSCKKDTDVNTCGGKTAADAGFKIYESITSTPIEADTVSASGTYLFWARNKKNVSYRWTLKSQGFFATYTDSLVQINNSNYNSHLPCAQMYTLTLVIAKTDLGNCKSVNSIDSLSKQFYIWPCEQGNCYSGGTPTTYTLSATIKYWPIWGHYKGTTKNDPQTTRIITIFDTLDMVPNLPCEGQLAGVVGRCAILKNIPYNNWSNIKFSYGDGIYGSIAGPWGGASATSFSSIQIPASGGCNGGQIPAINGLAWLDVNNSNYLTIEYQYKDTISQQLINDVFTGWRVY
jgi:hypothetical protein